MKFYELKLYDKSWRYKKTISSKKITSDITFSEELNGWQWELVLEIIDNPNFYSVSDIVEIREVDEENKSVTPTYTGIIEEYTIWEYEYNTTISIQLLWLFTALNDILFKQSWGTKFTLTGTAGNLIQTILNSFNGDYGNLINDTQNIRDKLFRSVIDTSWSNITLEFDGINCLDAIKKVLENTEFKFYIGADWICRIFKTWNEKRLTIWRQVFSVNRRIHKADMVNYFFYKWKNETRIYQDQNSIWKYWKKELLETLASWDTATLDVKGSKKIQDYSNPRNNITVNMLPQQSQSIIPWDMLYVNNTNFPIEDKQITKITKNKDEWIIEIGDFISLGNAIKKL